MATNDRPVLTNSMALTRELRQAAGDYDPESRLSNMLREASDEIEGAHHDIDRLMAACTAEANEVERLRDQLRVACIQRDNANDEIERLKKALDCWHDEYCGCAEGIANHRDLKLARIASSDEAEKQA